MHAVRNRNAVILVVDRLHVGYLGCYGNTWIATPQLDRLAGEAFVLDQVIIDSPSLEELYASYWSGSHVLARPRVPTAAGNGLAAALSSAGIATTLVSDEACVGLHPLAAEFAERIAIPPPQPPFATAADEEATHAARYFALAADWLGRARSPFCLWLHTQGLAAPWDAPFELRRQYADSEEAPPPPLVDVPCRLLADDFDPDERFGICQAYAGQVSLVDTCLGGLLAALAESPSRGDTLLALVAARGMPLGEHRRIGPRDERLYNELVHVPWLLRLPDGTGAGARSQALVQPADLAATLCDWWGIGLPSAAGVARSLLPLVLDEQETLHDRACVAARWGEQAIRTASWYLRRLAAPSAEADAVKPELYAKPDDFWELNDVADRCGEVVEALERGLDEFRAAAESRTTAALPPLDQTR